MRIEVGRVYPSPAPRSSREILTRAASGRQSGAGLAASPVGMQEISRALSLSRLSQQIIQQALSVSMRLKALAAQAAMTGAVDRSSLAASMAEINKSLGRYGENLVPPADTNIDNDSKEYSSQIKDLRPYLKRLSSIAEQLDRSQVGVEPALHKIENELWDRLSAVVTQEIDSLSRFAPTNRNADRQESFHNLASSSRQFILSHPNTALNAQGNIAAAAVVRLTG